MIFLVVLGLAIGVITGIILAVMIPLCNFLELPPEVSGVIIFGLIIAAIVAFFVIMIRWADDSKYVEYDANNKTLLLHSRAPKSAERIEIKRYEHAHFQYNPAELVYTGATVGGISMGGFHVNEAYQSIGLMEKTDKYELHYGKEGMIETIKCDFLIGDNKAIKKFKKDNNTLFLENKPEKSKQKNSDITDETTNKVKSEMLLNALQNNDYEKMSILTKETILSKKLTLSECNQIKDWIAGSI